MIASQKLAVRLSEIRQRLNEIAGLETAEVTDEIRTEADRLAGEYRTGETQHRSALIAEGEEAAAAAGEFGNGDGEPAETRALLGRVNLGDYLNPAAAGIGLSGAAVELAGALEVPAVGPSGGIAVPWRIPRARPRRCGRDPRAGLSPTPEITAGRFCKGRSFSVFSVPGSWTRSGCGSIPYRSDGRNGL